MTGLTWGVAHAIRTTTIAVVLALAVVGGAAGAPMQASAPSGGGGTGVGAGPGLAGIAGDEYRALLDSAIGPFPDAQGQPPPDIASVAFRHDDLNPGTTVDDRINFHVDLFTPSRIGSAHEIWFPIDLDGAPDGLAEIAVRLQGFDGFTTEDLELFRWDVINGEWDFERLIADDLEFATSSIDFWVSRDLLGIPRGTSIGIAVWTYNDGISADPVDIVPFGEADDFYRLPIDAAPLPPTAAVRGLAASTTASLTLGGEVNPGGVPTTYRFQFGTTPALGSETATLGAGAGRTAVTVSQTVGGLAAGTTYYWRLVADSAAGQAISALQQSTTVPSPPVAQSGRAVPRGARTLRMTGIADTRGAPGTAFFEYGPTTRFGSRTAVVSINGSRAPVSIDVRGLRRDTLYYYRLVVETAGGRVPGRNLSARTGLQNRVLASVDAPIFSRGSVFTVPRFVATVRIVGPSGRAVRAPIALRRVRAHILCTRGCSLNQRFSLGTARPALRSLAGSPVQLRVDRTPTQARVDLAALLRSGGEAYPFAPGAELQLRLTGVGVRPSVNVITIRSVARRVRCDLRGGRPVACEVP